MRCPSRSTAVVARPVPGRGNANGCRRDRCTGRVGQPVADVRSGRRERGRAHPHAPRSPGGPELDHEVRHAAVHAQLARRGRDEQQGRGRKTRLVGVEHRARVRRRDGEQRGRRREDRATTSAAIAPTTRRRAGRAPRGPRAPRRPRPSASRWRPPRATRRRSRPRRRPRERRALARGRDHGVDERPAMEVHEAGRGGEVRREPGESGGGDEQPAPLGRAMVDPHRPQASRTQPVARSAAASIRPGVRDDLGRDAEPMPARASAAMDRCVAPHALPDEGRERPPVRSLLARKPRAGLSARRRR